MEQIIFKFYYIDTVNQVLSWWGELSLELPAFGKSICKLSLCVASDVQKSLQNPSYPSKSSVTHSMSTGEAFELVLKAACRSYNRCCCFSNNCLPLFYPQISPSLKPFHRDIMILPWNHCLTNLFLSTPHPRNLSSICHAGTLVP